MVRTRGGASQGEGKHTPIALVQTLWL